MPYVDLPQGRLDYTETGDGRPVVFVHGYLMGGDLWHDVAGRLAPHGLRCIMPTWPIGAHRTALAPDADATAEGVAAMVAAFLEALDLRDVVLVGNDSGGALCQVVVTRHPERVGALVLTNCDAFEAFPPAPFVPLRWAARVPGLLRAVLAPLRFARVRRSPLGYGLLSDRGVDHLAAGWVRPLREDPGVLRDLVRFSASIHPRVTQEAARRLGGFERPVLLVWGTRDPFFPVSLAERLRDAFPDARLETLPGRVLVMVDHPDELARHVAGFAAGAPRQAEAARAG